MVLKYYRNTTVLVMVCGMVPVVILLLDCWSFSVLASTHPLRARSFGSLLPVLPVLLLQYHTGT